MTPWNTIHHQYSLLTSTNLRKEYITALLIRSTRYSVDENGKAIQSDRAGNNDWQNIPNTHLTIIVQNKDSWNGLTSSEKDEFKRINNFKIDWGPSKIDTSYNHLSKESAQLYASKGYELKKENFK